MWKKSFFGMVSMACHKGVGLSSESLNHFIEFKENDLWGLYIHLQSYETCKYHKCKLTACRYIGQTPETRLFISNILHFANHDLIWNVLSSILYSQNCLYTAARALDF